MKRIIKLTESDLTRIVRRIIKEQTPLLSIGDQVKVSGRGFNLNKGGTPSGKSPRTTDGIEPDGCEYSSEEKIREFFKDAKTWNGSVDEKYMNSIIEKMKKELGSFWTGEPREFLKLLGLIKTQAGMGYLVRTFKLDNKNLFTVLSEDHRFPWLSVVLVLKNKFSLPYGPSGCGGYV
jgi:hypothetical protein